MILNSGLELIRDGVKQHQKSLKTAPGRITPMRQRADHAKTIYPDTCRISYVPVMSMVL